MSASIIPITRVQPKLRIVRQDDVGLLIQYRLPIVGIRKPHIYSSFNDALAVEYAFEYLKIPPSKRTVSAFKDARAVGVYRHPGGLKIYPR